MQFSVRVPASSANLGSGFDSVGLALRLYTIVDVSEGTSSAPQVVRGPELYGGRDMVLEGMHEVARAAGRRLPGCDLTVTSEIPVARGLGSSATALVAGMIVGNVLLDIPLSTHELLHLAAEIEGHADNVSASLLGGVTLSLLSDHKLVSRNVPIRGELTSVVFIPDELGLTENARAVVPNSVPRSDAILNLSRCGLLVLAFSSGDLSLLGEAMTDRLHQPYRETLFPYVPKLIDAAISGGAYGSCLSGAGPTVLALTSPYCAESVGDSLLVAAERYGIAGSTHVLEIATSGAEVFDPVKEYDWSAV